LHATFVCDVLNAFQKDLIMAPHQPPCAHNETLWDGLCYPKIDAIHVEKAGTEYKFILQGVSGSLLPGLAEAIGPDAQLNAKQAGPGLDVTITSIPQGDAQGLLKRLRPDDADPKLPD
jgi:hypothetical protein